MTDKTEAMDNLIAQDADLIEICPDDLVRRLRSTVCQGNLGCHRLVDDDEAADRIETLRAEIERLREERQAQYDRGYYDGRAALEARGLEIREKGQ